LKMLLPEASSTGTDVAIAERVWLRMINRHDRPAP
jgi:hypothetical protein